MDFVDALLEVKGKRSKAALAAEVGSSYPLFCNQLNRRIRFGYKSICRVLNKYPHLRDLAEAYLNTPVVTLHIYPSPGITTVVSAAGEASDRGTPESTYHKETA